MQDFLQSITTAIVEDINLIELNSTSETGNDESSGRMVYYSAENAPASKNESNPDELMNVNGQSIQPMEPNVGEFRELVRRPVPKLLPIKERRMSIGVVIASICYDYDTQYLLPNNDENKEKELMKIDFNTENSFGKLD